MIYKSLSLFANIEYLFVNTKFFKKKFQLHLNNATNCKKKSKKTIDYITNNHMLYNILIELRKNIQLYFEGIDYLHIFVAIRFGRQVVAVNSLNIIYLY